MIKGLYSSAGGMLHRQFEQEKVMNNIANVNTAGFKQDATFLNEVINSSLALETRYSNGNFIPQETYSFTNFQQGIIKNTSQPLDLAIKGRGFFKMMTPSGERFSRNGEFNLTEEGFLVNSEGFFVLGEGGQIRINGNDIAITESGEVLVDKNLVDKIQIVNFSDTSKLFKEGDSLYRAENISSQLANDGYKIIQGSIEASNVNIVSAMTKMIDMERTYETNANLVKTIDSSLRNLSSIGRF